MLKQLARLLRTLPGWLVIAGVLAGAALLGVWLQERHDKAVDLRIWSGEGSAGILP